MFSPHHNGKDARIGVLDLQGGVVEHIEHLGRLGIPARKVRKPSDLEGLTALILPGGESTCLCRLFRIFGFDKAIPAAYERGLFLWGTCAGAILLAKRVRSEKPCLGLIDIEIERNAFGSQLDSFTSTALAPDVAPEPIPLTFIRAPKIRNVGPDVRVLLRLDDYIAAAESDRILVTVFHPELTPFLAFHRYFLNKCGIDVPADPERLIRDPDWRLTSWTRLAPIAPPGQE